MVCGIVYRYTIVVSGHLSKRVNNILGELPSLSMKRCQLFLQDINSLEGNMFGGQKSPAQTRVSIALFLQKRIWFLSNGKMDVEMRCFCCSWKKIFF